MESGNKKTAAVSISTIAIVAIAVAWWQLSGYQGNPVLEKEVGLNDVRNAAMLSPTKEILPTTGRLEEGNDVRFRAFDVKISKDGISPSRFAVNRGDRVQFNVTAADANYDFGVKQFGFYMTIVGGKTMNGSFDAASPGTFLFGCSVSCPPQNKMGELVILD